MNVSCIGTFKINNEAETKVFAEAVASLSDVGDIICLFGDLGAGKTGFCRCFIRSLTSPKQEVPSPTYTLVQSYQITRQPNPIEIWHYDLYRTSSEDELVELGIEDAFSDGIVLIEWPEIAIKILPEKRLEIHFEFSKGFEERIITLRGPKKWQYINIENVKAKNEKKNNKLIPETNINENHVRTINTVWPISGWEIKNKITGNIIKKLNKYLK